MMTERKRVAPPFWEGQMYDVYVLQSLMRDVVYVGSTPDVARRLLEHHAGRGQSPAPYAPLRLVDVEAYADQADALDREQQLQHHGSVIGHLKKRLKRSLRPEGTAVCRRMQEPKGRGQGTTVKIELPVSS